MGAFVVMWRLSTAFPRGPTHTYIKTSLSNVFLLYDFFFFRQFNVTVLTMHRWFDIKAAERDLGFRPIIGYQEGWAETIEWFRRSWLPKQAHSGGILGIATATQEKIDIQDMSAKKVR